MEEKNIVRDRMKRMRRNLSADQIARFSAQICDRLLCVDKVRRGEAFLLYSAVRGEADLSLFARQLFSSKKTVAYPRVQGDTMDFYEIHNFEDLAPGAFGIPEPVPDAGFFFAAANAVIFVPGVAFMEDGNRIGMGRGYYDRYLSEYPNMYRIGIAYEAQMQAVWKPDETDLPVNLIVTEERIICCNSHV